MELLGIDVGGTGIKGALVDVESGELTTERFRLPTPENRLPSEVLPVIVEVARNFDYQGPIGVGLPQTVINGVPKTGFAAYEIEEWIGAPIGQQLSAMTGQPVTLINDADAAGLAEIKFGAGRGQMGTVLVITLGTGLGSGLFVDGKLVPNTELGKLYLKNRNEVAEYYAAGSARERLNLKWKEWAVHLDEYLHYVDWLFSPQLVIVGGGVSKKHEKFLPYLTTNLRVVPAQLRNHAGIIGAAMAAG